MDSPLPVLIILAIVGFMIYHVGFRFETYVGGPDHTITYERDSLTGVVRELKPNESPNMLDRLLGKKGSKNNSIESSLARINVAPETTNTPQQEVQEIPATTAPQSEGASPTTPPQTVAAVSPQQPTTPRPPKPSQASKKSSPPQLARKAKIQPSDTKNMMEFTEDLNHDGSAEHIILERLSHNGKADISIVSGMQELFNAQGQRLHILSTKTDGWSDLSLVTPSGQQTKYRYNRSVGVYRPL